MKLFPALLLLLQAAVAHAATVGVRVHESEGGPLTEAVVQAVAWHAVSQDAEHDPAFLSPTLSDRDAVQALREAGASQLLDISIRWASEAKVLEGGKVVMLPLPVVEIVDRSLSGQGLVIVGRGEAAAEAGVMVDGDRLYVAPELALQHAMGRAIDHVRSPAWGAVAKPRRLPVVVVADAAWKARHGATWRAEIAARVDLASRLLAPVGIALDVVGEGDWHAPIGLPSVSARLRHLADQPRVGPEEAVRVGFTGVGPVSRLGGPEQVGRAFEPGRDVVIVDQRGLRDDGDRWDVSNEAVALAHEVLHALGVPHEEEVGTLMSSHHAGLVHLVSDRSRSLARAAVQARTAHWDAASAMLVLADAADRWLVGEPTRQLTYIVGNLPDAPVPGTIAPGSVPPIVDAALTRMYLDLAVASPESAASHTAAALVHAGAVRTGAPWLADELGDHLPPLRLSPSPALASASDAGTCDPMDHAVPEAPVLPTMNGGTGLVRDVPAKGAGRAD